MIYKKLVNQDPNYWIEKQTIQLLEEIHKHFDMKEYIQWVKDNDPNNNLYQEASRIELYLMQKQIKKDYCNFAINLNVTSENINYVKKFLKKFNIKDVPKEKQSIDLNISFSCGLSAQNDEEMLWLAELFKKYYNCITIKNGDANELMDKLEEWLIEVHERLSLIANITNSLNAILAINEDAINKIIKNNEV